MRARRVLVLGGLAVCGAVGIALAHDAWRGVSIRRALDEAEARLRAPLAEAPRIDRLRASSAADRLESLVSSGVGGRRARALWNEALAIEALQRGDLVHAGRRLEVARREAGGWTAPLRVLAAEIARRQTDLEAALDHARAALRLDPDSPRALLLAADIALDLRRAPQALEWLERLARIEPSVAAVHNALGIAREGVGNVQGAIAAYERARELAPVDPVPLVNLGRLHRLANRHEQALRAFEAALALAPSRADAWLGRGLALAALDRSEAAVHALRRAAELAPGDAEPLLGLGDLYRDAGRIQEALAAYREALAREDADAASWLKLGHALLLDGQSVAAEAAYRQAIARAPALAAAHNGLGAALLALGAREEARRAFERARDLDPGDPAPRLNLARMDRAATSMGSRGGSPRRG